MTLKKKTLLFFVFTNLFFTFTFAQTIPYPAMVKIQGGSYIMGGTGSDEGPTHKVTVNNFSIGKYEVTVAEYKAFCKASKYEMPDAISWEGMDNYPIVFVSYDDANAYCKWLSQVTGKKYRLPTEAEWEYAARGGSKSKGYTYSGGNDLDKVGCFKENANYKPIQVGRKKPNELGLYDMSGSVMEWCVDWYDYSYHMAMDQTNTNPKGPISGSRRVIRGGNYASDDWKCGVANRDSSSPDGVNFGLGFRVVSPE